MSEQTASAWRLDGHEFSSLESLESETLTAALATLHPRERCWFRLVDGTGEREVWLAGARMRLTIEARLPDATVPGGSRRVVLGRQPRVPVHDAVSCRIGPIYRWRSQVLTLADAQTIIAHVMAAGELPPEFDHEDHRGALDRIDLRIDD